MKAARRALARGDLTTAATARHMAELEFGITCLRVYMTDSCPMALTTVRDNPISKGKGGYGDLSPVRS
jgi:hypothetical protein